MVENINQYYVKHYQYHNSKSKHSNNADQQKPYYIRSFNKPIELRDYFEGRPFGIYINQYEVENQLIKDVLTMQFKINIVGNFKLPPNYFYLDIDSSIGSFRNITLQEEKIEQLHFTHATLQQHVYVSSVRININESGLSTKEILKQLIEFKLNLKVTDDNELHDQINYEVKRDYLRRSLSWQRLYNHTYYYANAFNLNTRLDLDTYHAPCILALQTYANYVYSKSRRATDIKPLKVDDGVYLQNGDVYSIKYSLEYQSLGNESKRLEWEEKIENIDKYYDSQHSTFNIQPQSLFKYDFLDDELVIDHQTGFKGIWLPKAQKVDLKMKIKTNYRSPSVYYARTTLEFKSDFTSQQHPLIKISSLEINNYEGFRQI
ncbi:hypothetical protein OF376_01120 [Ureaplasma miroungigenitalium]|uniref:DUF31 domain-containing protein n=1 Tax=Ureaplasma miroungigenitalium TaxID=1042321 RepID=A0ABT3BM92_9BACT|nr:hypothetical protein [Ureaplasma miroungigenitalium]MCV3728374.1 hypothetical protein [Ureaplasma miroungigenitalium]